MSFVVFAKQEYNSSRTPFKTFPFTCFFAAWQSEHATYCGTNGSVGTILINFYRENLGDRRALRYKRSPATTITRRWRCISFWFARKLCSVRLFFVFLNKCMLWSTYFSLFPLPRESILTIPLFCVDIHHGSWRKNHVLFAQISMKNWRYFYTKNVNKL